MTYHEEYQDLFSVPQGYYLAHSISADFALGAGVAKEIDRRYNMQIRLNDLADMLGYDTPESRVGQCFPVGNVCNLVTKKKKFQRPEYRDLQVALDATKEFLEANHIDKLAVPLIGCGSDRLNWDIVSEMIQNTFDDTDIDIMVCIND